jgi:predicted short-subunit dehydrogenase-like oxidoreductase (DUF2520 family)
MSEFRYVIIGRGNLAWHLQRMLNSSGISTTVFKSDWNLSAFSSDDYKSIDHSNCIVFLAVRDDVIESMAERFNKALLVHCSGSKPLDVLPINRGAVLWPIQTFMQGVEIPYGNIPFILECKNPELQVELQERFSKISSFVQSMDSLSRMKVHLAAVISQNFSNRLLAEADRILNQLDLDYKILLPLMEGALLKLSSVNPLNAQTGPAVRGDFEVLNSHLKMCSDDNDLKDIYRLISSRINPSFKNE